MNTKMNTKELQAKIDETKNLLEDLNKKLAITIKKEIAEEYRTKKFYVPLLQAKIKKDLYYKSEWCFAGIGTFAYYTVDQILGAPTFSKGETVVLISIPSNKQIWVPLQSNNEYDGSDKGKYEDVEDDGYVIDDTQYVRKYYLTNIINYH